MNPVFWLLVILGLIVLWFIISFVFIPIGSVLLKKWNKTLEILNKKIEYIVDEKEENNNE